MQQSESKTNHVIENQVERTDGVETKLSHLQSKTVATKTNKETYLNF